MRFQAPPAALVPFGLRAMKTIATVDQPLSTAVANVLRGAQRVLLGTNIAVEALDPIEPEELARHLLDPALRRQFVQGMLVVSLADGPPSAARMNAVERFARALDVDAPELATLRLLADKHTLLFQLDFFRHTHIARVVKRSLDEAGLIATAKSLLGMRGLHEDPPLAARYRDLWRLPPGTLGRAFADYIERNGFSVPGEKRGFPEGGIYHDFGHVLTGYDTDPQGEIRMAGFQAGFMKDEPVFMLLFGVVTFGAGVNVTPLPQPEAGGIFDTEGVTEGVLHAVERGAGLRVDLSDHWDHWAYVERRLDEVREELNLLP
jgi:hypothetical protein